MAVLILSWQHIAVYLIFSWIDWHHIASNLTYSITGELLSYFRIAEKQNGAYVCGLD